jgi:histidyl-tRNA synthetase
VDKLSKVGMEETCKTLTELTGDANTKKILEFIGAKGFCDEASGNFTSVLNRITELSGGSCPESERLLALYQYMRDAGGKNEPFILDPSITRGLDYYTGIVYETFLNDLPDIGSICSGGRYDNLAALYSKTSESISGVGSSIGLDRLLAALESLEKLPSANSCITAIACTDINKSGQYQILAQKLRQAGIPCEVFTEQESQLVKQFVLAEKKGMRYIIIPNDMSNGKITLRDIAKRQNTELSIEDYIKTVKTGNET